MSIAVLPDEVVARIAAGEAVERPASAVKELIENAIDAGATAIHIEAASGGRKLLRVSDNGAGIPRAEIELAFKRHATSKLRSAKDLDELGTLGFRGEALASIAAVSLATIVTRHRDDELGVSLRLNGGQTLYQRAVGAPAGTVVTIENLFFNTPARLKFLKADRTEKRHIHQVLTRYAMAYPNIAFTLMQDEREQFRSSGRGNLADVVAQAFGRSHFQRMIPIENKDDSRIGRTPISVRGFASLPDLTRRDRSRIVLFVNGRAIQDSAISHAATQAYEGLIDSKTFPLAVLLITLPNDFVDVNVHPTKAEVRFREPSLVYSAVQRTVRQALMESDIDETVEDHWTAGGIIGKPADLQPSHWSISGLSRDDPFDDADIDFIPETAELPAKPRTLPVLRVVGQVGATYIVAEGPAGLYLIDQNAAHHRVLYEQLCDERRADSLQTERISDSRTVLLSPEHDRLLKDLIELFNDFGFEIEDFGPNSYVLRALPKIIATLAIVDALPQMLDCLDKSDKGELDMTAALAMVAAVKRGQILQMQEMQSLVARLERCPSPFTSPDGAAVLVHLTREQLASEFRRG